MTTTEDGWTVGVYIAALALFVTHSIDSTRFAEWHLFRMSAEAYVFAYLPLMVVFLYGLVALSRRFRAGYELALLLGLVDVSAILVHGSQILSGEAFTAPLSLALIGGMVLAGLTLVASAGRVLLGARKPVVFTS